MKRSSIMTVQRLMRLKTNTLVSTRILSSSYPACHVHPQSRDGSFGDSHAMNASRTTIPTCISDGTSFIMPDKTLVRPPLLR